MATFAAGDADLLLALLRMPTVSPLELGDGDPAPVLRDAMDAYAEAASAIGFDVVHDAAPLPDDMCREDVPLAVRDAMRDEPGFLAAQPSIVLRLGPALGPERTVMFNVHLDTVAGFDGATFDGKRFEGRGAIDAKGPACAMLAGVRAAIEREPALGTRVGVLIQAVSGEEGGAMGTIGTRPLVDRGFVGRLNVFCEPTGLRWLPRATASMTARVRVTGEGSTDDRPEAGDNATVLLGFLAQHLASELTGDDTGCRVCVAGLHTGRLHNRVYGTGELLVNMSYGRADAGRRMQARFEAALDGGVREFAARFAANPALGRTARRAAQLVELRWLKRGLPTLHGADPGLEALLDDAGLERWPDDEPAFTCDAIWMDGVPGAFTVVLGPGDLAANNAHAEGEFAELAELGTFADAVARVLTGFCRAPAPAVAGAGAL